MVPGEMTIAMHVYLNVRQSVYSTLNVNRISNMSSCFAVSNAFKKLRKGGLQVFLHLYI